MKVQNLGESLLSSFAFASLGLVVLGIAFWILQKFLPFSIRKEIEEDQNVALAVILASVVIAVAIIVAGAIGG